MAAPNPMAAAQAAAAKPESHAGGVLAIFLLLFGLGVAYLLTPILSGLLGLLVLYLGWKFLKWRVDPLDIFFWMKGKPSWAAVGLAWLSGLMLLGLSYLTYVYINHREFISPWLAGKVPGL